MGRHSIPDPEDSGREPVEPELRRLRGLRRLHATTTSTANTATAPETADRVESPRDRATSRRRSRTEPAGPPSGGHRNDGEWTGSHRVVHPGRRGVSLGVIAALVAVVVLVAGVIVWRFFGDALSNRSDTAADRCLGGDAKVAVLADPAIADNISAFAKKFNESAGPGRRQVRVGRRHARRLRRRRRRTRGHLAGGAGQQAGAVDSGQFGGLGATAGGGRPQGGQLGALTGHVAGSAGGPTRSSNRLSTNRVGPRCRACRPIRPRWTAWICAGWGSLRLALPTTGDSDASYLAAEAVASASAPQGSPATAGIGAVSALVAGQPKLDGELTRRRHEGPARQQ